MHNYKLTIQYDGTRYSGWQKQGNTDQTIQGKLEAIAAKLTGIPTDVNGSGRTDAGVHALGQIANFRGDIPARHGISEKTKGSSGQPHDNSISVEYIRDYFNQALPMDIRIITVEEAAPRFHARLNACEKHYRYILDNATVPDVFRRRYAARIPADPAPRIPYDLNAMRQAAELLRGEHNYKSFCENRHMKKSTVRSIRDIQISQEEDQIIMDFYGNGFLYHMVRILVGTLLEVGSGKRQPEEMKSILETKSRSAAGFTAPAQGLFLVQVTYS